MSFSSRNLFPKTQLTKDRIFCKPNRIIQSTSAKNTAAKADSANTITVVSSTSLRVGHVIFDTSDRTCWINLKGFVVAILQFFLSSWASNVTGTKVQGCSWQGQQGSNPRPTVLETVALPAELYPYPSRWVCFFDVLIKCLQKLICIKEMSCNRQQQLIPLKQQKVRHKCRLRKLVWLAQGRWETE